MGTFLRFAVYPTNAVAVGRQKRVIQTTPSDEIAGFWTPLETWSAFLAGFGGFDRKPRSGHPRKEVQTTIIKQEACAEKARKKRRATRPNNGATK